MKKYAAYILCFMFILMSCTRKSDETCTEAQEEALPRLVAYFKPEGTKIKYKSTKGDTATLTFEPIVVTQGERSEQKPCKKIYFPVYTQKMVIQGSTNLVFPYKQVLNNGYSVFSFGNNGQMSYDFSDTKWLKTSVFVDGELFENVILLTKESPAFNNLTVDSVAYNAANFIIKIKDVSTNTVWTILK